MVKKLMLVASVLAIGMSTAQDGGSEFELETAPKSKKSRIAVKAWYGEHQVEADFDSDDDYILPAQISDTDSEIDGELTEAAIAIQKGQFLLEISNRSGTLDQDKTYLNYDTDPSDPFNPLQDIPSEIEQDHDDWELKGTIYWSNLFFTFFGYERKDIQAEETLQDGWFFIKDGNPAGSSRDLEITADIFQFGLGLAPQVVDTDHFNVYVKMECALLMGGMDFEDKLYGESDSSSAYGYFAKGTLVLEFPFLLGAQELRPFVDLGYRYQMLEPDSWEGGLPSMSEEGVYGRLGLSWRF